MADIVDFEALKVTIASPSDIKDWSYGEVTKPETINYRTLKPEKDGLFDERIFGPTKDWECYCGKYKRIRYRGIICDKCGVEVTQSRVRRERMGHIVLAAPVAHAWFFRGAPSKIGLILDVSPRNLDAVVYFASYLVISIDEEKKKKAIEKLQKQLEEEKEEISKKSNKEIQTMEKETVARLKEIKSKLSKEQAELKSEEIQLKSRQGIVQLKESQALEIAKLEEKFRQNSELIKQIKFLSVLSEEEFLRLVEYGITDFLKVGMGGEALLEVLKNIDLVKLSVKLREEVSKSSGQKYIKASKKLRVIEGMKQASINPAWLIIQILPVLPPDLRPMVQLSGGRFATSDLNDLYRRVINRNNRLKKLIDLGAPEIILRNEKRMLQESVDALIDSSQRSSLRTAAASQLRSLSDMLRGKQGRFRQNLLGKRVDYSGRSVIVVGPELKLHQTGIPKDIALEMFKPFVLRELINKGFAPNVKSAKHFLERRSEEVWDILEEITKDHPILLNRAPTLHRLGIQAFYPVLTEGDAIRIHPCICAGFNADFDGDQMAIHVPLSEKSQEEASNLMLSSKNLLRPADGTPITLPNKEMALGIYYLTAIDKTKSPSKAVFVDFSEAINAYLSGQISPRVAIKMRLDGKITETTIGRILFNQLLPASLPFYNEPIRASTIKNIISYVYDMGDEKVTAKLIDDLKYLGFEAATWSGLSVSLFDNKIIPEKKEIISATDKEMETVEKNFRMGLITREEQRRLSNEIWVKTTEEIADKTWKNFGEDNSIVIISDSGGSRATGDQIKQLAGMRGLVADPSGRIVPLPTKSNFREGLSVFEYFTSSRGARKGFADRALKTAESGYLTRRLIDVAHDVIIRIDDCETKDGIEISINNKRRTSFANRLIGRNALISITDPKTKKSIVAKSEEIDEDKAVAIEKSSIEKVVVRSPLTCEARYGICAVCYGRDLTNKKPVAIGTPVGVIAAQSIGEPGTQLTMRTFHLGGIVGLDITQGLPRVEELFEARTPKVLAPITEILGKINIEETEEGFRVKVRSTKIKPPVEREYFIPATAEILVTDNQTINAGTPLSSGYLDPKDILKVRGLKEAQEYIVESCQEVYESQGVPISDKHFEIIVKKMCDKVKVESPGDTNLLPNELIDKVRFQEENSRVLAEGGEPATAVTVILGITRAALYTESFLSAASFQETTNVLTDAAIEGKIDRLLGLKENVIIGRLIPTNLERAKIE